MDLSLDELVDGIIAVLAYEGRAKLYLEPAVTVVALRQTLAVMEKQMGRERIRPTFRLTAKGGTIKRAFERLEREHKIRRSAEPGAPSDIVWPRDEAYAWLGTTPFSIGFFERAAKVFWKQHETARIRVSLHRLATRGIERKAGRDDED